MHKPNEWKNWDQQDRDQGARQQTHVWNRDQERGHEDRLHEGRGGGTGNQRRQEAKNLRDSQAALELDWYCDLCGERKFAWRKICDLVPHPGARACQGIRPPMHSDRSVQGAFGDMHCEGCPTVVQARHRGLCPNCSYQNIIPEGVDNGNFGYVRAINRAENRELAGNRGISKIAKWTMASLRGSEIVSCEVPA
eukprot:12959849-Heterocapsa_arctica.AAC.1